MTPKKLHRFYTTRVPSEEFWTITDEHIVHQTLSILKFKAGELFIVFEHGGDDVTVEIVDRDKRALHVRTRTTTPVARPPRTIIAAVSIAKGASFEIAVQKLTEIGVSTIVPLLSDRTVKHAVRLDRLQKISDEALELSGGTTRVTISDPLTLDGCFAAFPYPAVICDGYTTDSAHTSSSTAILYVGPEGGWSAADEAVFALHPHTRLRLGERTLRTETAAIIGAYTLLWK